ncbi:MAG: hypothetical protein CMP10_07490 [Zetaproteobacteria bacterium]|nr:hypothetical protein [Pseudobdellovibrionaceae bacterium]
MTTAIIAGATGLTGSSLVKKLLKEPQIDKVITLVRKPAALTHEKLEQKPIIWDQLGDLNLPIENPPALGFCCLGTTIKEAGSQDQFIKVDLEYVKAFAMLCQRINVKHFSIVSAAGTSSRSLSFYSRVKGQMEEALQSMAFPSLSILRPGLLLGERPQHRPMEDIFQKAMGITPGFLRSRIANQDDQVAATMLAHALKASPGTQIISCLNINRDPSK